MKTKHATNLPVFKGQFVRIRGSNKTYIAQTDILSNPVLIVGDRAMGQNSDRLTLNRVEEFFKSSTNPTGGEEFPWAYLFSVDDFADNSTSYTDTSWEVNHLEGFWQPLGDGGGRQKTYQDLIDFWEGGSFFDNGAPYYEVIHSGRNTVRLNDAGDIYFGIKEGDFSLDNFSYGISSVGDGVDFFKLPIAFGANEKSRTITSTFTNGGFIRDRSYWVRCPDSSGDYLFVWQNPTGSIGVEVSGNKSGETRKIYKTSGYRAILEGASFQEFNSGGFPQSTVEAYRADAYASWANLDSAGYSPLSFPGLNGSHHLQVYTGQQIIDGSASTNLNISGNIPDTTIVQWAGGAFSESFDLQVISGDIISVADVFLIPITGERSPGTKSIYAQVSDNKKVLLHKIPSFEPWDGYLSPLPSGEIEVVIKCGKKWTGDFATFNRNSDNDSVLLPPNFFDRPWAQVRTYRLSSSGTVTSTAVFNNSETDLNPSASPDAIAIDPSNWQAEYLNTYDDYRTADKYRYENLSEGWFDPELEFRYAQEGGAPSIDSVNTGLRTVFSERFLYRLKSTERTPVIRQPIYSVGLGTLTNEKFITLNPLDLFDSNVAIDRTNTFGSDLFPTPNYTIFSGLLNQSVTNKNYYEVTGYSYDESNFTSGVAVQKPTNFPKLDLAELGLPTEITTSDRSIDNPDLLRVGIKAVAFLK